MTQENPTILLIEDDRFLRNLMQKKLEQEDFNLLTSVDGEEGLNSAKEKKPDLILLDLLLPSMSGWEVLKKIKNKKETKSIPVLILTNLGEKKDVEKGLSLGAADYIIKAHFTPEEIINKVKKYLD